MELVKQQVVVLGQEGVVHLFRVEEELPEPLKKSHWDSLLTTLEVVLRFFFPGEAAEEASDYETTQGLAYFTASEPSHQNAEGRLMGQEKKKHVEQK